MALEFVRVTEAAAIAAAEWIGRGNDKAADQAAVSEMRSRFNQVYFSGTVVIGEGSKDRSPQLYTGEKLGCGKNPIMDLAIDPLEATDSVAHGRYNAISVIAAGAKGSLLHAPDTYMDKIAVGAEASGVVDLDAPVKDNLKKVARRLGKDVREVTVIVLDRERHKKLVQEIRSVGSRVRMITDGDVAGAIATCVPETSGVDLLMGIGGSTESVLAAAAVKILGGEILCRFTPRNEFDLMEIKKFGVRNLKKIFTAEDLAKGDNLTFTATGIIEGPLLNGVTIKKDRVITHSMVVRGVSRTVRYITTHHHLKPK